MSECSGYGKVILFGEHFVVYHIPGIAAAIGLKTTGRVTNHDGVHMSIGAEGDSVEIAPGKVLDSLATTMSNVGMVVEDRRIAIKDYKLKKMAHARDETQGTGRFTIRPVPHDTARDAARARPRWLSLKASAAKRSATCRAAFPAGYQTSEVSATSEV